jgi:ethanolamine permease
MGQIVGDNSFLFHMLITIGLFGLVASFHGLILAAGRSTFEFGRVGFAPGFLGKVNSRFQTPANALVINMGIGIIALFTGRTSEIITISVFGALTLYIIAMVSLFVLRKKEPDLHRPFHVPFYPVAPLLALVIAAFSLVAMVYYNHVLAIIYFSILILSFVLFKLIRKFAHSQIR